MSLVGRKLGDFSLDKKLGQGGMGEVYKARQESLDRIVAVKVLPKSLANNEGFDERFRREARSAANLIHPNVIQVYHIGIDEETGMPYFAMEFVEGEDLQQRLKRVGRLPFEVSVELMAGVAAALSCAYEKGIVHRDIKPSNIMIDRNEIVKVMDFGLAKATQDKSSHNLTQSGLIMGTPNYISPEAGRGDPIDTRSDIYSLGVVFYELLTGELPFTAGSPAAIIYKHVYEEPKRPSTVQPDVPPFLEEVCLRMIAKEPKDRYPNPKALLADLNEFKRNTAHYMQGGQRRTPVIGSGSITGDQTLTASGSYPGRAGPGSRTNEQTLTFREGETHPDAQTLVGSPNMSGSQMMGSSSQMRTGQYTQANQQVAPPSSKLVPALVGALLLAMAAVGYFAATNFSGKTPVGPSSATGTIPGGMALFPGTAVHAILPKGVTAAYLDRQMHRIDILNIDMPVEAGIYPVVYSKKYFNDLTQTYNLSAEGLKPPLEQMRFDFKPSNEAKLLVEQAQHELDDQHYKAVIDQIKTLATEAPDYEEAAQILAKAQVGYQRIRDAMNKGTTFYNQHRYAEAIKAWADVPPSYDDYRNVKTQSDLAQQHLDTLKQNRENFEKYFAIGQYSDAATCLAEIDSRMPTDDTYVRGLRDRMKSAADELEAGKRELDQGNEQEAVTHLEKLLQHSPSHPEGIKLMEKARTALSKKQGNVEQLRSSLEAGEKAFQAGQYERAANEATRGLTADPTSRAAQKLLEDSRRKIAEGQITRRFAELDEYVKTLSVSSKEKKTFALVQLIDPASPAAATVKADAEVFAASPIRVEESAHKSFAFDLKGGAAATEASVECSWEVTLTFPEVEGAVPPAAGKRTALSVRQKVGLKRAGDVWLFTSFEEIGKANVNQ